MDPIGGLAARYCVRQDARGFLEAWGFVLLLGGGAYLARRGGAYVWTGVCLLFASITAAFAGFTFYWCYVSAAAAQGMPSPTAGKSISAFICLSGEAVQRIEIAIFAVAFCLIGVALFAAAMFRIRRVVLRVPAFVVGASLLLLALAGVWVLLFGYGWCASSRLFEHRRLSEQRRHERALLRLLPPRAKRCS